jgi:hypothetical protein
MGWREVILPITLSPCDPAALDPVVAEGAKKRQLTGLVGRRTPPVSRMMTAPRRIALVTPRKYDASYKKMVDAGWTLVRYRSGNSAAEMFDTFDELLATLVAESQ